jgi:hypothetical protein
MPQLALKIPVFRRWGKKFFVAVDAGFFASMPEIRGISELANSEITWAVYPFSRSGNSHSIGTPEFRYSTWDDVQTALREGVAPAPQEILEEIQRKYEKACLPIITT